MEQRILILPFSDHDSSLLSISLFNSACADNNDTSLHNDSLFELFTPLDSKHKSFYRQK